MQQLPWTSDDLVRVVQQGGVRESASKVTRMIRMMMLMMRMMVIRMMRRMINQTKHPDDLLVSMEVILQHSSCCS